MDGHHPARGFSKKELVSEEIPTMMTAMSTIWKGSAAGSMVRHRART
jgi:hypothetical protein